MSDIKSLRNSNNQFYHIDDFMKDYVYKSSLWYNEIANAVRAGEFNAADYLDRLRQFGTNHQKSIITSDSGSMHYLTNMMEVAVKGILANFRLRPTKIREFKI